VPGVQTRPRPGRPGACRIDGRRTGPRIAKIALKPASPVPRRKIALEVPSASVNPAEWREAPSAALRSVRQSGLFSCRIKGYPLFSCPRHSSSFWIAPLRHSGSIPGSGISGADTTPLPTEAKQAILRGFWDSPRTIRRPLERSLAATHAPGVGRGCCRRRVVARESAETALVLTYRGIAGRARRGLPIRREDGSTARVRAEPLGNFRKRPNIEMNGRTWVRTEVRLPIGLPLGYHDITVELGATSVATRYIVTRTRGLDRRPPGGRGPGGGCGREPLRSALGPQLGVRRFWRPAGGGGLVAEDLGASFVALHPAARHPQSAPFNTSPYLPNSSFYRELPVPRRGEHGGLRRANRRVPAVAPVAGGCGGRSRRCRGAPFRRVRAGERAENCGS